MPSALLNEIATVNYNQCGKFFTLTFKGAALQLGSKPEESGRD